MQTTSAEPILCPSCGTAFKGKHCYACGEKRVSIKDYSLKKYAEQAIDIFTHFDGKFFVSIKYLLFKPGKLTDEYLAGRRVKYMKPLQLYIIVNLLYFFFLKSFDIFYSGLGYVFTQKDFFALKAKEIAERKAAATHIGIADFIDHFNHDAQSNAKLFVFVFIPLIALSLLILYFKRYRQYVPHLVFATHFFSFYLFAFGLYSMLVVMPLIKYDFDFFKANRPIVWNIISIVVLVYFMVACKRVFKPKWIWLVIATIAFAAWFILLSRYYKVFITFYTLHFS